MVIISWHKHICSTNLSSNSQGLHLYQLRGCQQGQTSQLKNKKHFSAFFYLYSAPPKKPTKCAGYQENTPKTVQGAGLEVNGPRVQKTAQGVDHEASGGDGAGPEAGHDGNDVQPTT